MVLLLPLQAFMTHELHRKVNTRLGREQQLFSGVMQCRKWNDRSQTKPYSS
jgi:hypothetical protein